MRTEMQNIAYKMHKHVWGKEHDRRMHDQALEELAELSLALSHLRRPDKSCTATQVLCEYVDVFICLEGIIEDLGFTRQDFHNVLNTKISALNVKLEVLATQKHREEKTAAKLAGQTVGGTTRRRGSL